MRSGFTLIELLIVIVIIGMMGTLAVPSLVNQQEKGRAGEGVQALAALHGAQLRYCLDHTCGAYPAACTTYDVDIPALRSFGAPACAANGDISVTKSSGAAYTITVSAAGAYTCPACPAYITRLLPQ